VEVAEGADSEEGAATGWAVAATEEVEAAETEGWGEGWAGWKVAAVAEEGAGAAASWAAWRWCAQGNLGSRCPKRRSKTRW